ncbi:hypothetical protein WMY93_000489 [Mugilogobius chulae]|uniref:Uncharacterized protein n=1 Tax=Mugilogobius chulae TaxID=88201 RepID=A0AAW0PZ30_9GOBI
MEEEMKRTPLHAASYLGDAEIIELLILSGARVNAKDNKWLTPLHRAVASCSEEAVQVLLKHSADVNARDKNWQTPLHVAAANKAVRCAEALVPLLSNVNVSDRAGRMLCTTQPSMVRLLLSRGANINAFDKKDVGQSIGQLIWVPTGVSWAEVACKDKKSYTPLHAAASSGMISVVKYLLDLGVDSKDRKTPLHMTAIHGRFSRSQAIIENGAEIDCEDKNGNTPLHIAARYGHELLINTLITNRADTAKRGIHGMFPLHLAALSGFSDCCRKLLSSGFDIDTPDDFGRTCLHAAALLRVSLGSNLECLNLLLNTGQTSIEKTAWEDPLHYAAANCNYQCLFALVGSGASVNDLDERGCHSTSLRRCLRYRRKHIIYTIKFSKSWQKRLDIT